MKIGAQYYRPPFPVSGHWVEDMKRMKASGLDTVQIWVIWAWVESRPGQFDFDDYDQLIACAAAEGLSVVLSTIAEMQPLWIHREVPGSELVTQHGHKVVSGARAECHFGLTPGGCTDHPEVWARMSRFLEAVTLRYKDLPHLHGWDAWNELRWDVHAGDRVCFCEHTLREYRQWLDHRFGGLAGLNTAWLRRYGAWDEVRPGKSAGLPFTENMSFSHFTTWRACEHARKRYDLIKGLDPHHPVTVHGSSPSADYAGSDQGSALNRGNDWFFADHLDGVGTSSFPKWLNIDDAEFGSRVEFVKSAARGKHVWLSELQGGRSAQGFDMHDAVDALSQQRWIWNGVACGADTILVWCWRDEVFCKEAAGYGLIGKDGLAEERLAAMRVTGRVLAENAALIDAYQPDRGRVGLLFSPQSYYLQWSSVGHAYDCRAALGGYARALVKRSIPYTVVEEEHLEALAGLDILFLPRTLVTSDALEQQLEAFVRQGGTLVCESETGAFTPEGFYREESRRLTARLSGIEEIGRRKLDRPDIVVEVGGRTFALAAAQWLTPWQRGAGEILADGDEGALVVDVPVGKGHLILCASYFGQSYHARACRQEGSSCDFEGFVEALVRRAGCKPDVEVLAPKPEAGHFLYVKTGDSGDRKMVFVFFQEGQDAARLQFASGTLRAGSMKDLMTGARYDLEAVADGHELVVPAGDWRFAVLVEA